MAVTGIRWNGDEGMDIHLLRGSTSPRLDQILVIDQTPGSPVFANPGPLPADITNITFQAHFAGAPAAHGVAVDTATGAVTASAAAPAGAQLRNFLITARVTHTSASAPSPLQIKIRVHIHSGITRLWLTPGTLTVHERANGVKLTVLAEFADQSIGDITRWTNLTWHSSVAGNIDVDAATGILNPKVRGSNATITVALPPLPPSPNHTATAQVNCIEPWSTATPVRFVDGAGAARRNDVPNILFLPDGFENTSRGKTDFELVVKNIVRKLRTWRTLSPFCDLKDSLNYWMAFVPSREEGCAPLFEVEPVPRRASQLEGHPLPQPSAPAAGAVAWRLEELIHEVGLPVPADDPPTRQLTTADPISGKGPKLADWQALYGAKVTEPLVRGVYQRWLELSGRTLVNERDTAFGLTFGERPRVEQNYVPRILGFNANRISHTDFETFLGSLQLGGTTIGTIWSTGKDKGLICLLANSLAYGGANFGTFFTSAFGEREHLLRRSAGVAGIDIQPFSVPRSAPTVVVTVVAHETAHSFNLGDEYGGRLTLPASQISNLAVKGNLQPESELALPPPQIGLDGTKIKWLWPRIAKAGLLTNPPHPEAGEFRIVLKRGHGAPFRVGDIVRLRQRQLLSNPKFSDHLQVTAVAADEVKVRLIAGGSLAPADFPANSLLIVPVKTVPMPPLLFGDDLPLVAPLIRDHIVATKGPLNAPGGSPLRACTIDNDPIQPARNLPIGLPPGRPRYTSWIVGLYEGGAEHHCGLFHPSGACLMRALRTPGSRSLIYSFCPVCRYVIVDRIDPTKHGAIDAVYAPRYPQP